MLNNGYSTLDESRNKPCMAQHDASKQVRRSDEEECRQCNILIETWAIMPHHSHPAFPCKIPGFLTLEACIVSSIALTL